MHVTGEVINSLSGALAGLDEIFDQFSVTFQGEISVYDSVGELTKFDIVYTDVGHAVVVDDNPPNLRLI